MNRKQRRAAQKQANSTASRQVLTAALADAVELRRAGRLHDAEAFCRRVLVSSPDHPEALHLLAEIARETGRVGVALACFEKACRADAKNAAYHRDLAAMYLGVGRLPDAAASCRRALALEPDRAEVHNNLGAILMAQGDRAGAGRHFEQALALTSELFDTYADVLATFYAVYPGMREAIAAASRAWPSRPELGALTAGGGVGALADNTFFIRLLESHTVCDVEFERFLTSLRRALLAVVDAADEMAADTLLRLSCALARQCFLNEYVFPLAPDERERVESLKQAVIAGATVGRPIVTLQIAVVAAYLPLAGLPVADQLIRQEFPPPFAAVVAQQIREPRAETEIRADIPRLTDISNFVSVSVQRQYEEHPYPRWVHPASRPRPEPVADYLRRAFPLGAPSDLRQNIEDALVAGCGTGWQSIDVARRFVLRGILAVDLSAASLAFAIRRSRELGVSNVEYAQADIVALGSIGRTFDFIDSIGVLHHLADPFAGWRVLLSLLRAGGVMRVGLYSETGRRAVVAARQFITGRNYAATVEDIRQCRQELIDSPLRPIAKFNDFFSMSECRDLLFHVQEHRFDLPAIETFLATAGVELVGFELAPPLRELYRRRFSNDAAMTNLDHWHAIEQDRPDTFASMYQFWIVKR